MSGHSKWHQIKHKKGATDQKRGALFSKLVKAISVAARDNPSPDTNPRLRTMIEKAKQANVPNENIERAMKRSSEAKELEEVTIEAYGPDKVALIIIAVTDNQNRTIAEVKAIITKHGAKPAHQGSVLWSFTKTDGEWHPSFTQPPTPEGQTKLDALIADLEAHDDVSSVVTNAA
ncbi:MAG: YebC/PmpR family DNA-binding transcriptional regulator [Patescibacteria group bacterium]